MKSLFCRNIIITFTGKQAGRQENTQASRHKQEGVCVRARVRIRASMRDQRTDPIYVITNQENHVSYTKNEIEIITKRIIDMDNLNIVIIQNNRIIITWTKP